MYLKGLFLPLFAAMLALLSLFRRGGTPGHRDSDEAFRPPVPPLPPRRTRRHSESTTPPALFGTMPIAFPLGRRVAVSRGAFRASCRPFVFNEVHAAYHQLVLGTTGSGKSRYCELQCRFLLDSLRGFCFIDPDGDTSENLMAYAASKFAEEGSDAICRQVVYVELSFAMLLGYDPFSPPDFSDVPAELRENAYRAWLPVKVDQFCEIVQAKQGGSDFTGMARLQRVLRTVLTAVGTAVDPSGRHLPLSEVFALLDCDHRRHEEVYAIVGPHLPEYVRAEFERWHGAPRAQRLQETESTLNRLRSLLSPLVLAMFTEPARRLDFRRVIDGRMILLVNLRQTDFLSADQQRAVGTLFVKEIWSACKVAARADRPVSPFYLYIDEAHMLMETAGGDMEQILFRGRKYKLSLTLIGQYLGQFRNERVDMIPAVLNLCRSFACFLHSNPDDLDVLKRYFGYPNLDFTELMQVADRPDGYDLVKLKDYSRSYTCGTSWNRGTSTTHTTGTSEQITHSQSHTAGQSDAVGKQANATVGRVANSGQGEQFGPDGHPTGSTQSNGQGLNRTDGRGTSQTHTAQSSDTSGTAASHGISEQHAEGVNSGEGGSEQHGWTESEKTTVIPKTRVEWHPTGRLRHSVEDQFHEVAQVIATLGNRQAVVRLCGEDRTFRMEVGDVLDVFPDPGEMAAQLKEFREKVFASHRCYFAPDLSPAGEARRLDAWLRGDGPDKPADPDSDRKSPFGED